MTVLETPPPVTVIVPFLGIKLELAVALMVMFLVLVPLVGELVSHEALLDTVHDVLDITEMVVLSPPNTGSHLSGLTDRLPMPAWVTVIVLEITLSLPVIVIIPTLWEAVALAAALMVIISIWSFR